VRRRRWRFFVVGVAGALSGSFGNPLMRPSNSRHGPSSEPSGRFLSRSWSRATSRSKDINSSSLGRAEEFSDIGILFHQ
jgi:hypothetical protein